MNYNHLFYFHVTALEGSIAGASKKLHVSQPTISEQLKQLEEYFGKKLFERKAGGLRLNSNGRQAFEYTERIFSAGDRLKEVFIEDPIPAKARVEIGMISSAAHSVATDRLVKLFGDTRTVVKIRHGDNQFLLHELISSGLDILITDILPPQARDKKIKFRKIGSTELVFVASADFKKEVEDSNLPDVLHKCRFIHYTSQSSYRWEVDRYFRDHSIVPDTVAEVDDAYLILHAVNSGIGIGVVPRSVLMDSGENRDIYSIGILASDRNLFALYHESNPTEETLRALDILSGRCNSPVKSTS